MPKLKEYLEKARLVFSNAPSDRLPAPACYPLKGCTTGQDDRSRYDGTMTYNDLQGMFGVLILAGKKPGDRVNVLIFDPEDPNPKHAVLAKDVRVPGAK